MIVDAHVHLHPHRLAEAIRRWFDTHAWAIVYRDDVGPRAVSGADRLRLALERHPEAVVIVPHLGFDHTAQFEEMLADFPNLHLDTTMVVGGYFERQPDPGILRRHPDRILYGTDFPTIPYSWDRELRAIRALRLAAVAEEKILAGNALRPFGPA